MPDPDPKKSIACTEICERTQGFTAGPVYGRARCSPMPGSLKT